MITPVSGVSERLSYDLFLLAKEQLNTDKNKVLYLPDAEYNLLASGLSKELLYEDKYFDSLKAVLRKFHQVDYLLKVKIDGLTNKENSYGYYTANELNQYNRVFNEENQSNQAVLMFNVYHTSFKTLDSYFSVRTHISPLVIKKEDASESRVNLTNKYVALKLAYEKGLKKIKKNRVKNKSH